MLLLSVKYLELATGTQANFQDIPLRVMSREVRLVSPLPTQVFTTQLRSVKVQMILSEQRRRWSEIRFYYICLDLYHIRHNMIDVILTIEVISQIAETDFKMLKIIAGKMMGDPTYLPHRDEVVSLAYAMKIPKLTISKLFKVSRSTVDTILASERNRIQVPFPQFNLKEDEEMYKFCKTFDEIKKAGI